MLCDSPHFLQTILLPRLSLSLPPSILSLLLSVSIIDGTGQIVRIFSLSLRRPHPPAERYAHRQISTSFKVRSHFFRSDIVLSYSCNYTGYPGIPPGAPDRPQAAVKGVSDIYRLTPSSLTNGPSKAIEVRMGPQGVKAKYVRIQFRKIETLPGGGQNSFFDYVGQGPVNLWQSSEEFSVLQSVSFPSLLFSLSPLLLVPYFEYSKTSPSTFEYPSQFPRLSHSTVAVRPITRFLCAPPDFRVCQAGIKYEIVGQVCVQGKSYVFPFMAVMRISPLIRLAKVASSVATSQPFCLPQLPSPSTSTNFTPPGPSSSNANRVTSPRMR